jgi:hypothetical protein
MKARWPRYLSSGSWKANDWSWLLIDCVLDARILIGLTPWTPFFSSSASTPASSEGRTSRSDWPLDS